MQNSERAWTSLIWVQEVSDSEKGTSPLEMSMSTTGYSAERIGNEACSKGPRRMMQRWCNRRRRVGSGRHATGRMGAGSEQVSEGTVEGEGNGAKMQKPSLFRFVQSWFGPMFDYGVLSMEYGVRSIAQLIGFLNGPPLTSSLFNTKTCRFFSPPPTSTTCFICFHHNFIDTVHKTSST